MPEDPFAEFGGRLVEGDADPFAEVGGRSVEFDDTLAPQRAADRRAELQARLAAMPPPALPPDVQSGLEAVRSEALARSTPARVTDPLSSIGGAMFGGEPLGGGPPGSALAGLNETLAQYGDFAYDRRIQGPSSSQGVAARDRQDAEKVREALILAGNLAAVPLTRGAGLIGGAGRLAAAGAATSLATEPIAPSGSLDDAAIRAALEAGLSGGGELLGRGLAVTARPFASRLAAKGAPEERIIAPLFPPDEAGARTAAAVAEKGATLTPALQSPDSKFAALVERGLESSFAGSTPIAGTRQKAIRAATEPIEAIAESLRRGLSKEQLGEVLRKSTDGNVDLFQETAGVYFKRLDDEVALRAKEITPRGPLGETINTGRREVLVDLRPEKASARRRIESLSAGVGGENAAAVNRLREVLAKPDQVTFSQAQALRSSLLNPPAQAGEIAATPITAAERFAAKGVDAAMEAAALEYGGEIEILFRQANAFYKAGVRKFSRDIVKAIGRGEPEAVFAAIRAKGKQGPSSIRAAREAVADAKAWQGVKSAFLDDLIEKSMDSSGDIARDKVLKGQKLLTQIKQFGNESARELLGSDIYGPIKELAENLERTQRRTGSQVGGINISGLDGIGAGATIVIQESPIKAAIKGATIYAAHKTFAKAFTNPAFVRALTQGISAPAGSVRASRALGQISTILLRIESQEKAPARRQDQRLPTPSMFATASGPRGEAEPRIGR